MELDWDHNKAMEVPLGECTDEQLLAEVARRKLDLHDKITDALIKETYDIGKILGHGASGKVYLATHKITGQKFACKVVKKNNSMNDAQSMSTEIEIMKRIRHRNIVSMYELYETPKCLWIILELVDGGDLHHFLAHTMHYNEVMAARQFKQILTGLHYLHALGVVHRDLKLDNILMSGSGANCEMKIADFGLSALVRIDEEGYDPEESGKRKNYRQLKDVSYCALVSLRLSQHELTLVCLLSNRCGEQKNTSHQRLLNKHMDHKLMFGRLAAYCTKCCLVSKHSL